MAETFRRHRLELPLCCPRQSEGLVSLSNFDRLGLFGGLVRTQEVIRREVMVPR
jgi:hypothetical protein